MYGGTIHFLTAGFRKKRICGILVGFVTITKRPLCRMEILHNNKVIEAEHIKKLIRQKQLEAAYRGKRHLAKIPPKSPQNAPQEPYFVMLRPKIHTPSPVGKRERKNSAKVAEKKEKVAESGRSEWLVRKNSTVQFNPTENAKNVWHRPDLLERLKFQNNGFVDKQYRDSVTQQERR